MLPYPDGVYGGGRSSAATLWTTTDSPPDTAKMQKKHVKQLNYVYQSADMSLM